MIDLKQILENRTVDIYDGTKQIGETALSLGAGRVSVYNRSEEQDTAGGALMVRPYNALVEAADCVAGVCMLNDRAIKVLVAMYPSAPKYVLVRLAPRTSWFLGTLGLARRLLVGLVRIRGIAKLGSTRWLVLEQTGKASPNIPVLPKAVGIQSFLDWLSKENIKYVVLRFYDQLPELHREAGDLDILVADSDKEKVEAFLKDQQHLCSDVSDDIRIGLHSVSGNSGLVPYYPPPLARQILKGAIDGPANSHIPAAEDALLSFMYHCLYHAKKGYTSGIPSNLKKHIDKYPENDYVAAIERMASEQGIEVGRTMGEMDEYLAKQGWRPKLDTLAKIAETNAWVQDRFFAGAQKRDPASGLSVFVLREWVVRDNLVDEVTERIQKEGYTIITAKELNAEEQNRAFEHLRGGTWGSDSNGNTDGWKPAFVLVVLDEQCARMPKTYAEGFERFRIRQLKDILREKFDKQERSSMHSTDNTRESWEYIEVCFPESAGDIRKEVEKYSKGWSISATLRALSPRYLKHSGKQTLRDFMIRNFLT